MIVPLISYFITLKIDSKKNVALITTLQCVGLHFLFPKIDDVNDSLIMSTMLVYRVVKIVDILIGGHPEEVSYSIIKFGIYFFSNGAVVFDEKFVNVRKRGLWKLIEGVLYFFLFLLFLRSVKMLYPFFGNVMEISPVNYSIQMIAVWLMICSVSDRIPSGAIMMIYGDGIDIDDNWRNGLFMTKSLSHMWRGWNIVIHKVLKSLAWTMFDQTILAIFTAFFLSAVLHEYMIFLRFGTITGSQMLFFMTHFIMLIIERKTELSKFPWLNRIYCISIAMLTSPLFFYDSGITFSEFAKLNTTMHE